MTSDKEETSFKLRVYAITRMIPRGKVATYGQVAALAGSARASRACGHVLRHSAGEELPWQRVINAQGRISGGGDIHRPLLQRQLLEAEGVVFRRSGSCDLKKFLWEGPEDALDWE